MQVIECISSDNYTGFFVSYNYRGNHDGPNFKWAWFGKSMIFHDSKANTKVVFLSLKLKNQKKQQHVIFFESEQCGYKKITPNFSLSSFWRIFVRRGTYRIMKIHRFSKPSSFENRTIMVSSRIMRNSSNKIYC